MHAYAQNRLEEIEIKCQQQLLVGIQSLQDKHGEYKTTYTINTYTK